MARPFVKYLNHISWRYGGTFHLSIRSRYHPSGPLREIGFDKGMA